LYFARSAYAPRARCGREGGRWAVDAMHIRGTGLNAIGASRELRYGCRDVIGCPGSRVDGNLLRDRAHQRGIERAANFAIQCRDLTCERKHARLERGAVGMGRIRRLYFPYGTTTRLLCAPCVGDGADEWEVLAIGDSLGGVISGIVPPA